MDSSASLGGIHVDPQHFTLTVYWHGSLPANETSEIASDRATGMTVDVASSAYTEAELVAESKRLILTTPQLQSGTHVSAVSPLGDGSGLTIAITGPSSAKIADPPSGILPAATITKYIPSLHTAYPHKLRRDEDRPSSYLGNGNSNFNRNSGGPGSYSIPGAYIRTWGSSFSLCTTGFAVSINSTGHDGILTAAHCGWTDWYTGTLKSVGRTVSSSTTWDSQVISAYSIDDVWGGPDVTDRYGTRQYTEDVTGKAGSNWGDSVCESGSITGEECWGTVSDTNTSTCDDKTHICYNGLVRAYVNGYQFVHAGDSGGPVYSLNGNGTVTAKGIIHGYFDRDGLSTCNTAFDGTYEGPDCGSAVLYEPIGNVESALGVRVKLF
ncbi:MAG: hypothetical protein HOV83_24695 [Catenulispora sp.]|nr:hypothetical protein [Catenulispora sp.]